MYHDEVVAVICDINRKPLRELDSQKLPNGRKTKVFLPFNSEYCILVKNNSDRRIKLSIDIDGTNVSGNGLILNVGENDYIERFVDVAKKFLFVKASDERVADPSNKENGVIKIRVRKERDVYKEPQPLIQEHHHHHHHHYDNWPYNPYVLQRNNIWFTPGDTPTYGSITTTSDTAPYSMPCSAPIGSVNGSVLRGADGIKGLYAKPQINCYATQTNNMESGATVEGGISSQKFDTTVWNGDMDTETVFTFQLFATDDCQIKERMEQFLKLKKELGL